MAGGVSEKGPLQQEVLSLKAQQEAIHGTINELDDKIKLTAIKIENVFKRKPPEFDGSITYEEHHENILMQGVSDRNEHADLNTAHHEMEKSKAEAETQLKSVNDQLAEKEPLAAKEKEAEEEAAAAASRKDEDASQKEVAARNKELDALKGKKQVSTSDFKAEEARPSIENLYHLFSRIDKEGRGEARDLGRECVDLKAKLNEYMMADPAKQTEIATSGELKELLKAVQGRIETENNNNKYFVITPNLREIVDFKLK